jgi:hypothetical protein
MASTTKTATNQYSAEQLDRIRNTLRTGSANMLIRFGDETAKIIAKDGMAPNIAYAFNIRAAAYYMSSTRLINPKDSRTMLAQEENWRKHEQMAQKLAESLGRQPDTNEIRTAIKDLAAKISASKLDDIDEDIALLKFRRSMRQGPTA